MKKMGLILGIALMLLALSACGKEIVTKAMEEQPRQPETAASAAEPLPAESAAESKAAVWALDPAEVTDDFAADTLIRLPELALSGLGFTFDSPRELTAEFAFADGSTASLVWFYADGGLVYNGEFSRLPGETSAVGEN